MKFYDSMCSTYHAVIQEVKAQKDDGLYQKYADRLYSIVKETDGIGWGYHDYVVDDFFSIPWRKE